MPVNQGTEWYEDKTRSDMTPGQRLAMDLVTSGEPYVFITGNAGSGKSFVTRRIIDVMQSMGKNVLACAPTGLAAMNIQTGMTIHAAFGFPAEPCIIGDASGGMALRVKTPRLVRMADLVLVDEVSMVDPFLMDSIILSLRKAQEETGRPKTLVVVGDFHQLACTLSANDSQRAQLESFYGARYENWYAFMGKYWDGCGFRTVFLSESLRQEDPDFIGQLNCLRKGDPSCLGYFNTAAKRPFLDMGVSLFAYRKKVLKYNERKLDSLEGERYSSETEICYEAEGRDRRILRQIEADIPKVISFKKGAQILFTATDYGSTCSSIISLPGHNPFQHDKRPNFVNGMAGTILEVEKGAVIIKTEDGRMLRVEPMARPYYTQTVGPRGFEKTRIATYTQYPFMLSYAMTIHKSQGQTLTRVNIDPETFAPGQLYVAVSRAKSMEGIHLMREIIPSDLKVDPVVLDFYERAEKKAGISQKKGRPTTNVDGSRRSMSIHVPKTLEQHVREEVRQNRIIALPEKIEFVHGRINIRVTERLYSDIKSQIDAWKKSGKK